MKNKVIIILSVLILLFLITGVSANDVNTTEISASDVDDVASIDNENLNNDDDMDESADLVDSKILSESNVNSSTNNNDLKENIMDNSNNKFNKEVLSSSNSEILGINNNDDILRDCNINGVSFTSNSATVSFSIQGSRIGGKNVQVYARVGTSSFAYQNVMLDDDYKWSGTITVSGTYTPGTSYNADVGIEGQDSTYGTYTYSKATPTVTISSSKSINYNSGTYSVSGTCSVNGLTITLKAGSTTLGSTTSSSGSWTVSGISSTLVGVGSYTLTASSTSTSSYNSGSGTSTLTVSKNSVSLYVYSKSVNYNTGTYSISGSCGIDGLSITLKVGSTTIGSTTSSGGSWSYTGISSTRFSPGSYTIYASYGGSSNYYSDSDTATLTVSKSTPTITVTTSPNIIYGDGIYSVSGTAKIIKSSNSYNVGEGTITLKCGDILLGSATVSSGSWIVSNIDSKLVDPKSDSYTITAYYESNTNYNEASGTNSLTVSKFTPDIYIDSTSVWYNQTAAGVLKGKVYTYNGDFYSGFIDLYVNGELVASDVAANSSGNWNYTLSSTTNLSPSTYGVRVDWKGNEYTNENSLTENKYTVNKGMVIPVITSTGNIDIGRSEYVYVDVNNVMGGGYLSGMTVTLQGSGITGILEEISDVNGRATFIVPDLDAGKYNDWKVSVVSNDYYSPTMSSFNVASFYVQYPLTVTITSISPNNSTYPDEIIVTGFTDADQVPQGNVSLTIGGKTYLGFFNSTGNFTASLVGVKPGTYNNITTKYIPTVDEFYYRGVESTVSISETRMIIC